MRLGLGLHITGATRRGPAPVNPLTLDALYSGHSLVNTEMPVMVQRFVEAAAIAEGATPGDVDYSVINGSSMQARWEAGTGAQGVIARDALEAGGYGLFTITEAGPIETYTSGAPPTLGEEYGLLFFDLATAENPGIQVHLYTTWAELTSGPGAVIPDDSLASIPWRNRPLTDLHRWEGIADYVNANKASPTARDMLVTPVGLAFGRLYDDVALGLMPGASDFFTDFFEDTIHCNDLGNYFVALVHYACTYRRSPIGLPRTLANAFAGFFEAPSAPMAARMQAIVWDVVRSYPRSGLASPLAPVMTHIGLSGEPVPGVALTAPWLYATGFPQPSFALSWRLDGVQVSTAASFTPVEADIGKAFSLRVTADNDLGSSILEADPVTIAAPGTLVAQFGGATYATIPLTNSASFTLVFRFSLTALSGVIHLCFHLRMFNSFSAPRLLFHIFSSSFAQVLHDESSNPSGGGPGQVQPMGFPIGLWNTVMVSGRADASLPGGRTVSVWANGVLIHESTTPVASGLFANEGGFFVSPYGVDSIPECDLERVWISTQAGLDPAVHFASFFDGDGLSLDLPAGGVVGGASPAFWMDGDAARWNSELDLNGAAFTLIGDPVTQGSV